MENNSIIQRSFQPWKIWLAILIGVGFSTFLLIRSLSEKHFIKVTEGTGSYNWVDANHNGKVDLHQVEEFVLSSDSGEYNLMGFKDLIQSMHWGSQSFMFLGLAVLLMIGRDFFYILRIRQLTKKELSWKASTYVILIWEFASAVSPGVVGGAAVAMFILNKEKLNLGRSTAIVFITAMMDNLFYVLMIPLIFLVINNSDLFPSNEATVETIFWFGYAIVFSITLFLFVSVFYKPQLATRFLKGLFSLPILRRWKTKAVETSLEIETTASVMQKEPLFYWVKVFLSTMGSWLCRYLVINAILQAFIGFGIIEHLMILMKQFILWLFMLVSPTPGGSGVAEYAFTELLGAFASSGVLLVTLALIWRLISYFPYLFLGALLLPRWLQRTRTL